MKTTRLQLISVFLAIMPLAAYAVDVSIDGPGYLYLTAPSTAWTPPNGVTGKRFFWYPGKAAFRAGELTTASSYFPTLWNDANIGSYSFAFGKNAMASGTASFSIGGMASADNAIAVGNESLAQGLNDLSIGQYVRLVHSYDYAEPVYSSNNTAIGSYATLLGSSHNTMLGESYSEITNNSVIIKGQAYYTNSSVVINAMAEGDDNIVISAATLAGNGPIERSVAIGYESAIYDGGLDSVVVGSSLQAIGTQQTIILGCESSITGNNSVAIGSELRVEANQTVVIGRGNENKRKDGSAVESGTPSSLDPVMELAVGTLSVPKNALTIFRDGTVHISKIQGGIPMGQFQ